MSKYGWAGVLTQSHTTNIDGKAITTDHPVAFVSGLFRGSQLNWAALTKDAFAIEANEVQIVPGIEFLYHEHVLSYGPRESQNIKPLLLPDAL